MDLLVAHSVSLPQVSRLDQSHVQSVPLEVRRKLVGHRQHRVSWFERVRPTRTSHEGIASLECRRAQRGNPASYGLNKLGMLGVAVFDEPPIVLDGT
jgi:hypothetical protein